MKKNLLLQGILLFIIEAVFSQTSPGLSPVASELFKTVKSRLSVSEKNRIASALGFILSGSEREPFAQDEASKDYPFAAFISPTDLNKDGKEEVFVLFGNTYTSGHIGSRVTLFIANSFGDYTANLGFPGMWPDALETISRGYPELLVGGPGFEFPVWRWNGEEYVLNRKVHDSDYEKLKKRSIEEMSKAYQDSLN